MESTKIFNIVIAESGHYAEEAIALYSSLGNVTMPDENMYALLAVIEQCEVLVTRLKYRIDKMVLEKAQQLKYIITPTTGLDHIDLELANKRGIEVISLQGDVDFLAGIPSTAEHTWALLLALVKHIPEARNHVLTGGWNRNLFKGNNLRDKKIGIIGYGRVGQQVHTFARAFGMEAKAWDIHQQKAGSIDYASSIDELLAESDIVCIHIPLASNYNYLNKERLEYLKKNCLLINTSRGQVWDEYAVAQMLMSGHIKGVATDVVSEEPDEQAIQQNPLIGCMRKGYHVIVTPHIAGATFESMWQTEIHVAQKWQKMVESIQQQN